MLNAFKMKMKTPDLPNVSRYWSNGDFETSIGAAGHMGLPNVIEFFINKGVRPDISISTTLGKTDWVSALTAPFPNILNAIRPYRYTLLHHAEQGSENARDLYHDLQEKRLTGSIIEDLFKDEQQ